MPQQGLAKLCGAADPSAVHQHSRGVHRLPRLGLRSPRAGRIEILQCETQGVHQVVAHSARWILAMFFESLPN